MAGIDVIESFVYGEVPTLMARNLERCLPGIIYRQIKQLFSYGMGICCAGRSK
jgi:hypothetical protein